MKTDTKNFTAREWIERIVSALLFAAVGTFIITVFSPWRPLLDRADDYIGRICLMMVLLIAVLLVRRSKRYNRYWQIVFGLLVLAVAVSLDWIINIYLIEFVGLHDNTLAGWALPKLNECIIVVCVIVLFTRLSHQNLGSIYIQKGKLKLGLIIGFTAFFVAATGSIPMANLFKAQSLSLSRIIPWIPWLLIFVLANAALEEVLFRGLFLRKLEPIYGKLLSNILIAIVFTVLHGSVTYTGDQRIFIAVLFPLALAWGYIMQKTDSIWGSILFHAGMDIPIMLGIFSNLF